MDLAGLFPCPAKHREMFCRPLHGGESLKADLRGSALCCLWGGYGLVQKPEKGEGSLKSWAPFCEPEQTRCRVWPWEYTQRPFEGHALVPPTPPTDRQGFEYPTEVRQVNQRGTRSP